MAFSLRPMLYLVFGITCLKCTSERVHDCIQCICQYMYTVYVLQYIFACIHYTYTVFVYNICIHAVYV